MVQAVRMEARELAQLPWAASLQPFRGELRGHGEYDGEHLDRVTLDEPNGASARFIECAFTGVTMTGGELRRARLSDVWVQDSQFIATGLAETSWLDVTLAGTQIAGSEAFGSQLRRVTFRGCKIDSVNFREAELTDVAFEGCLLRSADFGSARLTRVSFADCRLDQADLSKVTLDQVDLRGAELGLIITPESLRGAIVTTAQLYALAPVIAETLGITVDGP
jgi:uncharacterized protein YjbI with pentapeptide repeats